MAPGEEPGFRRGSPATRPALRRSAPQPPPPSPRPLPLQPPHCRPPACCLHFAPIHPHPCAHRHHPLRQNVAMLPSTPSLPQPIPPLSPPSSLPQPAPSLIGGGGHKSFPPGQEGAEPRARFFSVCCETEPETSPLATSIFV